MSNQNKRQDSTQAPEQRDELALDAKTVKDLEPKHGSGERIRGGQNTRQCSASNMT